MGSKPKSEDTANLASRYFEFKKNLNNNLVLVFSLLNIIVFGVEIFRAYTLSNTRILTYLLPIFICILCIGIKFKNNEDSRLKIIISFLVCLVLQSGHVLLHSTSSTGLFSTPQGAFYLGCGATFISQLIIDNMPTAQFKFCYDACWMLLSTVLISPPELTIFVAQAASLAFRGILEDGKEKLWKKLFSSKFNYKEQLVQFKDLVVNDIPESIMIISSDLSQAVFVNNSFQALLEQSIILPTQDQLSLFKLQDTSNNSCEPYKSPGESPACPKKTLLNFLQCKATQLVKERLSCNLTYTKPETANQQGENQEFMFEAKVFRITWNKESSIAIILHDITKQNTILSLQLADLHKDIVLATVSHELRTPINGMLGMIQIMLKRVKDKELLHYLSICKSSGSLLLGIVNSILDLNQIRSNKLTLFSEKVSLPSFFQDILSLFELQCKQKGITLQLKVSAGTPNSIITDRNRLSQIFINLVGNAVKFTNKGGITISISEAGDKEFIQFQVEDTGSGIKEEDQGKLFKMFGRLEHNNKALNRQSIGLGLTISNNLVKLLSGNQEANAIKIKSIHGLGTTFSFLIKRRLAERSEMESFDSQETEQSSLDASLENCSNIRERMELHTMTPNLNTVALHRIKSVQDNSSPKSEFRLIKPSLKKLATTYNLRHPVNPLEEMSPLFKSEPEIGLTPRKKVLSNGYIFLVDDHPFNITVAEHLIVSLGYKVRSALSGESALGLIQEHPHESEPIKLILMDCQMPIMDGYETTEQLRKLMLRGEIPKIPIVALTANDSELNRKQCIQAGMSDHLTKPLKEGTLKKVLQKYVRSV